MSNVEQVVAALVRADDAWIFDFARELNGGVEWRTDINYPAIDFQALEHDACGCGTCTAALLKAQTT